MKFILKAAVLLMPIMLLSACSGSSDDAGEQEPPAVLPFFENVDFAGSPFKHINNGGITGSSVMPYNIDAITGATVTIEGAGVERSIPLSVREIQNANDGLVRAVYTDSSGLFVYEGMDLYYLLHNMTRGDKGIFLTDKAYSARLMDHNRVLLADVPLSDIEAAHKAGRPFLLAYGIATPDMSLVAPFVFDGANPQAHSEGYIPGLGNDGGCLKLVYNPDGSGGVWNEPYPGAFPSLAYIYIAEESEPGFMHTTSADPVYSSQELTDYIITISGDALGAQLVFTVGQLENLVLTDADGRASGAGLGHRAHYSLANNAYWYVNEYEGLDLYKLLLYLGMESAEAMGRAASRTTLVRFIADDGFVSPESFSVEMLSMPEMFGFYRKNAIDMDDGTYVPTSADLESSGYPVLLAYGVNGYPYTVSKNDDGYLSGLSNDGGPMRVVFGKTQYHHPNGSNQVKFIKDIIAGNDVFYSTHLRTDNPDHNAYTDSKIAMLINDEDGNAIFEGDITVGDIEAITYGGAGGGPGGAEGSGGGPGGGADGIVIDHYQVNTPQGTVSDIYQGVSLEYFLLGHKRLPGTNGTATFYSADGESVTVNLGRLFKNGYNTQRGRGGIPPVIAFAKNGSPLVPGKDSPGYIASLPLRPFSEHEPAGYIVDNAGGPLAVLIPSSSLTADDTVSLMQLAEIEINLVPDAYAHISPPYSAYADDTVRFYGEGLEREGGLPLSDIVSRQVSAKTLDFSFIDSGMINERRFRGVSLFDLLIEFGIAANAGDVFVHDADGNVHQFSLGTLRRADYINYNSPDKEPLSAMLAYGTGNAGTDSLLGMPLVPMPADAGFDAAFDNSGGPLMLVIPQGSPDDDNRALWVRGVTAIEVTAVTLDTWGHAMSDIYSDFLSEEFTLTIRNDSSEWSRVFTVSELEEMPEITVRDTYTVLDIGECEGIDIWRFVRRFAGDVPGIDSPVSITAFASDGYMNDLLSVFGMDAFELGVPDGGGSRKPLIIAYAVNGLPLVDTESHVGYTGFARNMGGPLRVVAETNQGASVKYASGLTVVLPGTEAIEGYIRK